jgi:predicted negative regulator of RcsB-dependent stress response
MEAEKTDALFDFYGWLHTNRKRVAAGTIVVAVIAAIIFFVSWNKSQNELKANEELLGVPAVLADVPAGDAAAATKLQKISRDYAGTSGGATAQLLAARELFRAGKYAEAQQEFSRFIADYAGSPLVPQANVGIAAALEAQGKTNEAVQQYKKVNTIYSGNPNIVLPVKLTLGRLSEADNKPDQAVNYYKELAGINDPNDPWVAEAYERMRLLVAKHPELNPNPPQSRAVPSPLLAPTESEMQMTAPPSGTGPATAPPAAPATNQTPAASPPATNAKPAGTP